MSREEKEAIPMLVTLENGTEVLFSEHAKELANSLCESFEDDNSNNDLYGTTLALARLAKDRGVNWLNMVDAAAQVVEAERKEDYNPEGSEVSLKGQVTH
jgi:hypothetical protein